MKPITTLSIIFLILFTSCGSDAHPFSRAESRNDPEQEKSPEELRMELKALEEESPLAYITGKGITLDPQQVQTRRTGLFRDAEYAPDGAIISGRLNNAATLARYKDAQLKLSFYSQTNTLIDEQTYTIYEYLEPNSSKSFSFKIDGYPEATDYFRTEIVGVAAVRE